MLDLRKYSDDELSLVVFNTSYLYNDRHEELFIKWIRGTYYFRKKQLDVLKQDISDDLQEYNNE